VKDAALIALAGRHGVVTTAQLDAAGFARSALTRRVESGLLRRLHRGVYAVGPIEAPTARVAAALLACGPGAALSHHTAAQLHDLPTLPRCAVDVTAATRHDHAGIRLHRSRLAADDITRRQGLPTTTVARALLDLAATVDDRALARLVEEAEIRGHGAAIDDALRRHRGNRGARRLAAARHDEPRLTRSEAEARMLDLVRAARLPVPRTNVRVGRHEVDVLWPDQRLVVEIDGYHFHASRAAFERDRRRDAELQAAGHRVLRVTWRQITQEAPAVVATLAGALAVGAS